MRILMFVCAAAMFAACEENPEPDTPQGSGLSYKSCEKYVELSGEEQTFSVTIQTSDAWTARVSGDFTEVSPASGVKGRSTLQVSLARNTTGKDRTAILSVTVEGFKGQTLCQITQTPASGSGGGNNSEGGTTQGTAQGIIEKMDEYMASHYLWNEAYLATNRNFNLGYEAYLKNVLQQMHDKGQNLKDGHQYGNTWYFYSYIQKVSSTRAETRAKSRTLGFGMDTTPTSVDNTDNIYFIVNFVYPGSPAEAKGIKRGDIIYKINGTKATRSTYNSIYNDYFYGQHSSNKNLNITLAKFGSSGFTDGNVIAISSGQYYETPVVFSAVYEIKGKRIGYLVYTSFDADYDSDLHNAFKKLKEYNITEMILDLRDNGGGHVSSSQLLSSILGGSAAKGNVFTYYLYNDERMKDEGRDKNNYKTYYKNMFDDDAAGEYGFNFNNIYVVGNEGTASASELTINALRGIDKKVIVTGAVNTNGKDVGMEGRGINVSGDGYYEFFPITFQTFNNKGQCDYDDGFKPDLKTTNYEEYIPYYDWGTTYSDSTGNLAKTDFVSDIFLNIAGSSLQATEVKVLYKSNSTAATRSSLDILQAEGQPRLKIDKTLAIPETDPRKTNMFIMRDATAEE